MENNAILVGVALLAVLAALAFVGLMVAVAGRRATPALPVVAKRLMTDRERTAITQIEQAMPNCRVHSQVAMAALLDAKKGLSRKERIAVRNRFDRKIVDFVLEEKTSGDVLAIIELDDRTHNAAKDRSRDDITTAAGYRTIRLAAGTPLELNTVRKQILDCLSVSEP